MEVIAGRSFDRDIGSDLNHAYLLNETAVKEMAESIAMGRKVAKAALTR